MMPTFARNRGQKPLVELQATSGTRFEAPTTKIHQSTQDAHRERSYAGFLTRPGLAMQDDDRIDTDLQIRMLEKRLTELKGEGAGRGKSGGGKSSAFKPPKA